MPTYRVSSFYRHQNKYKNPKYDDTNMSYFKFHGFLAHYWRNDIFNIHSKFQDYTRKNNFKMAIFNILRWQTLPYPLVFKDLPYPGVPSIVFHQMTANNVRWITLINGLGHYLFGFWARDNHPLMDRNHLPLVRQ